MTDPGLFPDPPPEEDERPTGEYPAVPATDEDQPEPPAMVNGELFRTPHEVSVIKG